MHPLRETGSQCTWKKHPRKSPSFAQSKQTAINMEYKPAKSSAVSGGQEIHDPQGRHGSDREQPGERTGTKYKAL